MGCRWGADAPELVASIHAPQQPHVHRAHEVRAVRAHVGLEARPHRGTQGVVETPLGEGDVNIETYLRTLNEIGYTGPLTIEREIPNDPERQKAEISHAVNLLNTLKAQILG